MSTVLFIIVFFYLFLAGCEETPYNRIIVDTGLRQETIPGSCSAFTEGCNIFCRTGRVTYKKIELKNICKDADLRTAECIDDEPEKLKLCKDDTKE